MTTNTKILIHLPKPMKQHLDDLRDQGVPTSWFIRALLEREFAKPPKDWVRPAMLKTSTEVDEEIETAAGKLTLPQLRPMIRKAVKEALDQLSPQKKRILKASLSKKKGGPTHGAKR